MSLWTRSSRLQELLGGTPRIILGEFEDVEDGDRDEERTLIALIDQGTDVLDNHPDESDYSVEIIAGSFAALAVTGTAMYLGLSRCYPMQMRRLGDASRNMFQTVVQVNLDPFL